MKLLDILPSVFENKIETDAFKKTRSASALLQNEIDLLVEFSTGLKNNPEQDLDALTLEAARKLTRAIRRR